MATATKTKAPPAVPVLPTTFAEINARRMRERIEKYREIVQRHANGEPVTVENMERAAELLEHLGLPAYTFERDVEALQRANATRAKLDAAIEAQPAATARASELAGEIEAVREKLEMLREEHRQVLAKANKGTAYEHSLRQLGAEHPHVLADIDTAVRFRIEELDRRKQMGGAA
jgi:hypothetical protein